MNTVLNNLIIYNGYPLSIVAAVLFHSLILVFLIWLQSSSTLESLELVQPTIIKALIIDENPQTRNKRIIERQRIEESERENQSRLQQEQELEQVASCSSRYRRGFVCNGHGVVCRYSCRSSF